MAVDCVPLEIDRRQVLAHRVHVQGLDRADRLAAGRARDVPKLAVLDLGVQASGGAAPLALANRLEGASPVARSEAVTAQLEGDHLATVWSLRGSPHVHRRRDLARVAEAVWPLSDRDAIDRLGGNGAVLDRSAHEPLDGYRKAIDAMAATVTEPMTKAEASAAVTCALPEGLKAHCKPCGAVHVFESLFRMSALPAGLELRTERRTLVLAPIEGWVPFVPPSRPARARDLMRSYLRLLGPATEREAAALVGTTAAEVAPAWPGGLVPVRVGRRDAWFPERDLDALRSAPDPDLVRLLPPYDPYLRGWDRDVLVPDRAHQKEIWRALGNPGVVLVDGEVRGTWRPKTSGKRLKITVTAFATLPKRVTAAISDEAALVATLRGATAVDVLVAT